MMVETISSLAAKHAPRTTSMNNNLDNPYYYLENFQFVLSWVRQRYGDLLEAGEIDFVERFAALPIEPRALLVRMVMRKGDLFRASKLRYEEIGDTRAALHCLIEQGWVEADPPITLELLFALLTKQEFAQALDLPAATDFQVKFRQLIRPLDPLSLALRMDPHRRHIGFEYRVGDATVSSGKIKLATPA